MEELLVKMAEMKETTEVEVVDDAHNLDWDSREAIRQANKISKHFGEPSYVNTSPGGSITWFDLEKPMPFSQITVEDATPYGFWYGRKAYSSFTILMRLSKPTIDAPVDLATYNHNNGKLICHAENWKQAVIIAVAVNLRDSGGLESVERMYNAWKDTKDVSDFVTYLIGEDDDTLNDEEEEASSPVPILIEKKEAPPSKKEDTTTSSKKEDANSSSKKEETKKSVVDSTVVKPNIKSPGGKPRGKARVTSPPARSPVKTIGVPNKKNAAPPFPKK